MKNTENSFLPFHVWLAKCEGKPSALISALELAEDLGLNPRICIAYPFPLLSMPNNTALENAFIGVMDYQKPLKWLKNCTPPLGMLIDVCG